MKGLILQDLYQLKNYSGLMLVLCFLCVLMSGGQDNGVFMTFYPSLLMGMLPMTAIAYDERSRFHLLYYALPCKKTTYVTSKYILGIILNVITMIAVVAVQSAALVRAEAFSFQEILTLMSMIVAVGLISPALVLPFVFAFGVEKGRIFNLITLVIIMILITTFSEMGNDYSALLTDLPVSAVLIVVAVAIYFLSWVISKEIFKRKEKGAA